MIDPKDLLYTENHEWLLVDGDTGTVGITRFAVDQLTDLIRIGLETATPGSRVTAGKPFGEIESVKAVSDLYSPADGEILEVNSAVVADVLILNEDPYTRGWLLKIRLDDPAAARQSLLTQNAYESKLDESPHH